jgi:peptidoglycan LD-endopeptidase LytH
MQPQLRNIAAAGIAGVIIGAVATTMLMSGYTRPGDGSPLQAAATDADDVVAVLDADLVPGPGPSRSSTPAPASGTRPVDPTVPRLTAGDRDVIEELRDRRLVIPVEGIAPAQLVQTFNDRRSGARTHHAIDILAPRNTPVLAVEDGRVARLFISKAGGITLYQYDPSERFVYYYAHLERYAGHVTEGAAVRRGEVIGYVGTSGNAPPNTPHLHFAIFRTTEPKRWWEGTPIDPFLVLR